MIIDFYHLSVIGIAYEIFGYLSFHTTATCKSLKLLPSRVNSVCPQRINNNLLAENIN